MKYIYGLTEKEFIRALVSYFYSLPEAERCALISEYSLRVSRRYQGHTSEQSSNSSIQKFFPEIRGGNREKS